MKRPTLLAFSALLAVCVVAQPPQEPLRCYECSFGCIKRDTTTCKAGEMCSTTTEGSFHWWPFWECSLCERCSHCCPCWKISFCEGSFHCCKGTASCGPSCSRVLMPGAANFIKRGCLAQNLCNLVEEKTVMWIPYKIKYSCCSTPLCNN